MNCCGLLHRDTFDMGLIYAPDFFMKLMKQGKKGKHQKFICKQSSKYTKQMNIYISTYLHLNTNNIK